MPIYRDKGHTLKDGFRVAYLWQDTHVATVCPITQHCRVLLMPNREGATAVPGPAIEMPMPGIGLH